MSWHLSHRWADLPGRRGRLIASPEGGGLGRSGGTWRVLHEVWVLLAGMWVYSTVGGVSCSMHNPWPVHPGPRAVADLRTCAVGVHRRPAMREHLGVHTADMGGSTTDRPGGNPWNSADLTLLAAALRRSCPLHGHLPPARRPCPCLRSEETRHDEARSRPGWSPRARARDLICLARRAGPRTVKVRGPVEG